MTMRCDQKSSYCRHYVPDYNVVFKIVTPEKVSVITDKKTVITH